MKTAPRYILTIAAVTAAAFLLSQTALNKFLSLSTYSGRNESFSFSDFYVRTASHGVARMSGDIVVVDIGDLDRAGIAVLLESLAAMQPKAIAIDVFFRYPGQEGDLSLTDAVCLTDGMVLPLDVNHPELVSFFYEEATEARFGAVNLSAGTARDVVRSYRPVFDTEDGPVEAMALVVADRLRPDLAAQVRRLGATDQFIRYDGVEFPIFEADEILSADASVAETVRGKAVFAGDLHDLQDMHVTPVDPDMPGLLIHAKIAQTILSGRQIRQVPQWLVVLIAVLVCALFIWIYLLIRDHKWGKAAALLTRGAQFLLMYAFFNIGYRLYVGQGILLNFSLPMLMLGLAALAFDLVFGFYDLFTKVLKKK